jgi:hypothetical protein
MGVDVYDDGDNTTIRTVNPGVVTSVDSTTVITGTTITAADNNDYIHRDKVTSTTEIMGLRGIVDDGGQLDALQTITRSSAGNGYWKASVVDKGSAASPVALAESFMQEAMTLSERNDGEIGMIVTTYGLRDSYAATLTSDKRYVNTTKLKGGFKTIDFNDTPLVPDKDCTPYSMNFLDLGTLEYYESAAPTWMNKDGAILSRVADYDAYEATLYTYSNLGVNNCVKNVSLTWVQ